MLRNSSLGVAQMKNLNVVRRVAMRGGWIGLFSGESQGKALERVLPELNADGYRVAFVVPDHWSIAKRILSILVLVVTLGFVGLTQNLLIIGERAEG
jgi:hypothetical protein